MADTQELKPAGTIVSVGVIPGAIILSNNFGEIFAIDAAIAPEVIECMQRMTLFSSYHDPNSDKFILAENWPRKQG